MFLDYCCRCCGFTLIKRHGAVSLKTTPSDTWVVLQNLLMCTLCFYSLYYVAVSLCVGLLRVHEINSLLAPFDYTTQPSWQNPKYLVGVISTEVTYVLGGLVFAWIVEEWVWDYAITVTLLHVAMTVAGAGGLVRLCNGCHELQEWLSPQQGSLDVGLPHNRALVDCTGLGAGDDDIRRAGAGL
ncbi:transmembrane protein 244 isoform X2 [Syngnathus acus]|uniref:transmembrane protein 244 isoform X2 n=1 Tax=Syngnathus acus TaxID=161584 RepID=UPI001885EC96|nr:transmembrane protein 244 isoform X2 [Syngnathus acus]